MGLFNKVILLTINLKTTKYRLATRTDNDFAKTPEVQDYVLKDKDSWEDEMIKKGAIVVDAYKDIDSVAKEVIEIAK